MQFFIITGSLDRTSELATSTLLSGSAVSIDNGSVTSISCWKQHIADSASSACLCHAIQPKASLSALQDEYADEPGTVIASDFYHSNELMPLSDEAIINRVVSNMGACEPAFLGAQVSTVGEASVWCFGFSSVRSHTPCQQPSPGDWWVFLEDVAWQCRGCTDLVSCWQPWAAQISMC